MTVTVSADGVKDLDLLLSLFPKVAPEAMSLALNQIASRVAIPAAKRDITAQVNFPPGYLDQPQRLYIRQFATPTRLETIIEGRDRPTSLARFAAPGTPVTRKGQGRTKGPGGVVVNVGKNGPRRFGTAFLLELKNANIGFAIRLRQGETVHGVDRFQPIELTKLERNGERVFLLYGPSVNQVFQGVAEDIEPEVTSALEDEFGRQFRRLSGAT